MLTLDAPVSGGVGGATAGTLAFMCGGRRCVSEAKPMLDLWPTGGPFRRSGCGPGGQICNNMMLGATMMVACEAFALAEKLGLSAQALFDVASTASGQSWSLTSYCPVPGPGAGLPRQSRL